MSLFINGALVLAEVPDPYSPGDGTWNLEGNLRVDGNIVGLTISGFGIEDSDGDTYVRVEQNFDDDTIRMVANGTSVGIFDGVSGAMRIGAPTWNRFLNLSPSNVQLQSDSARVICVPRGRSPGSLLIWMNALNKNGTLLQRLCL